MYCFQFSLCILRAKQLVLRKNWLARLHSRFILTAEVYLLLDPIHVSFTGNPATPIFVVRWFGLRAVLATFHHLLQHSFLSLQTNNSAHLLTTYLTQNCTGLRNDTHKTKSRASWHDIALFPPKMGYKLKAIKYKLLYMTVHCCQATESNTLATGALISPASPI